MMLIPPPLTYASTSSEEHAPSCPPWVSVGWLIALLVSASLAANTMVGQYEKIGQPMAIWMSIPPSTAPNQRFAGNGFGGNNFGMNNQVTSSQASSAMSAEIVTAFLFCLLVGIIASAALWHWPRPFLWLLLVLPVTTVIWYLIVPHAGSDFLVAVAAANSFPTVVGTLSSSQRWSTMPMSFGVQVIGIAIGLVIGRPIARLLATILLPPGMRASVVPYWTAAHRR